jgi:hypothetical protein
MSKNENIYRRWIKISRYISIISFILLVVFLWDEEFMLFAFFLIVFLASIIAPIDFKDKIEHPYRYTEEAIRNRRDWAKESTNYLKPLGYTRNFKISLGITILMLLLTVITWMEWVWPILVLLFSSAITFMLYLTDVKGKGKYY